VAAGIGANLRNQEVLTRNRIEITEFFGYDNTVCTLSQIEVSALRADHHTTGEP